MKKLFALLLAVTLLVSVSVTAFALPGMDSKTVSGQEKVGSRFYRYDCVLSASTKQFSARMTYDYYDFYITCKAKPYINYLGVEYAGKERSATAQGTASVSGDSHLSSTQNGEISWVRGTYVVRTTTVATIDLR